MTPNKPIGTAKVELPEFYTEEMLEARCHKAVAWHIRALQAYIQQPSPLVEENRRLKELLRRARVQLNYAAGALPVNAHRSGLDKVVAAIKAALAQPETKGER